MNQREFFNGEKLRTLDEFKAEFNKELSEFQFYILQKSYRKDLQLSTDYKFASVKDK